MQVIISFVSKAENVSLFHLPKIIRSVGIHLLSLMYPQLRPILSLRVKTFGHSEDV